MIKKLAAIAIVCGVALSAGCVTITKEDFVALQGVVRSNQDQLGKLKQKVDAMQTQMEAQRQPQASLASDLTAMQRELAQMRGQMDETAHSLKNADQEGQAKAERATLGDRLAKVEGLLGIKAAAATPGAAATPETAKKDEKPSDKQMYETAATLYQKKQFDAARSTWENLLATYPKSAYGASTSFWIGETYYSQKRFEEAILAYNQVIKKYSKSQKVPAALLKQGLAFSALGDKRTAKIVLNKLAKEYPKSSQAKIAKDYLKKMK